MNISTHAKDMFYLERHKDLLERRIKGIKGCLKTTLGNTPANRQHLKKVQQEHTEVVNEIAAFTNYLKIL